jgi:hypothetical protein
MSVLRAGERYVLVYRIWGRELAKLSFDIRQAQARCMDMKHGAPPTYGRVESTRPNRKRSPLYFFLRFLEWNNMLRKHMRP